MISMEFASIAVTGRNSRISEAGAKRPNLMLVDILRN